MAIGLSAASVLREPAPENESTSGLDAEDTNRSTILLVAPHESGTPETIAVIYARVSNQSKQRHEATIDQQWRDCEKLPAVRRCDRIVRLSDDAISGTKDESKRDGYAQVLKLITDPRVRVVAVREQSRIAREFDLYRRFLGACVRRGDVQVPYALGGGLDYSTAHGKFMGNIQASVDELYSAVISEKLESLYRGRRESGLWITNRAAFGYRYEGEGILTVDEAEADTVRLIYSRALDGLRLSDISEMLNAERRPTPHFHQRKTGTKLTGWAARHVRDILVNPVYAGRYKDGDRGKWLPIIDDETFDAAKVRLANRRSTRQGVFESSVRGYVRCSCGRLMKWHQNGHGEAIYGYCASKRAGGRQDWCQYTDGSGIREEVITGWIDGLCSEWDRLGITLSRFTISPESEREAIEAKLAEVEAERRRVIKLVKAGLMDDAELDAESARITSQRERLERSLSHADDSRDLRRLDTWPQQWRAARPVERRALIAQLFESITVRDGAVIRFEVRRDYPEKVRQFIELRVNTAADPDAED